MNRLLTVLTVIMFVGVGIACGTPVYNDMWDIGNGASFVGASGIIGGAYNAMGMFGQALTQYESGTTFFNDGLPPNTVHSITWSTPAIATGIGTFNLVAGGDDNAQRSISRFVLWAGTTVANLQVIFDSGAVDFTMYGTEYQKPVTSVVPNASLFKADFYQGGSTPFSGPRVIELDGFAAGTPEPATCAMAAAGLGLLLVFRSRSRRAH